MGKIPYKKTQGNVNVYERLNMLNKKQRHAVLATDSDGCPYTSLVAFALTPDGNGLVFATPKKTTKYRNMLKNSNVSVLIDSRKNTAKGYMESEAVTIIGIAKTVRKGRRRDRLLHIFTAKHPDLTGFLNSSSTAIIMVSFEKIIHAGKFQTVTSRDIERE